MDYIIELPFLQWDQQGIIAFMQSHPTSDWQHEHNGWARDQKYINKYLRTQPNKLFDDIFAQLPELELKHEYTFFMELNPKVLLQPHVDFGRSAVINFPLIGDWEQTPIRFHSTHRMTKDSVVCEHVYTCPTMLNVSKLHSAYNVTQQPRYMLSMSVHEPWEKIKEVINKYMRV